MKKIILMLMLCFCFISYGQENDFSRPVSSAYTTISYFIGASDGCNEIWVGVFCEINGTKLLVSSGTVCIGDGCRRISENNDSDCKDAIIKGELVENSKYKYKYCLTELLKDDDIYAKYEVEKNRILSQLKK
ncbi:MAG: hypothetical protein H7174_11970 [Flavobacterium sp.]|nr:hypothetical protein [Flavobacterium sp.]